MSDITSYVNGRIGSTYEIAILRPSNSLGYNFTAGTLSINTNTTSLDSANGARSYDAKPTLGLFKTVQSLAVAAEGITLLAMLLENGVVVATKTFTDPGDNSVVIVFDGYTGSDSMTIGSTSTVSITGAEYTQVAAAGGSVSLSARLEFEYIVAASQPAADAAGSPVKPGSFARFDRVTNPVWARSRVGADNLVVMTS